MTNGNGHPPTNAEFLTQAIQGVIDEAVDASREITTAEVKRLGKEVDCVRRMVAKQGLLMAQQAKDIGSLKGDMATLKSDVADIKRMLEGLARD